MKELLPQPHGIKLEFYTYLNGLKVGVYIDDEGGFLTSEISVGAPSRRDRSVSKDAGIYSYYFSYDGQGNVVQVSNKAGELPYYLYAYDSYGFTTEGGGSYEGRLLASYKGYDRAPSDTKPAYVNTTLKQADSSPPTRSRDI